MSRPNVSSVILACLPLAVGCSSYHYMREPTPELQTSRQEYVVNNPGTRFNEDIQNGRIRKGMSRLQVRSTWGEPDQVTPRAANSETWSYQETEVSRGTNIYNLRFDGELLTAVDMDHSDTALGTAVDNPLQDQKTEVPAATSTSTLRKPGMFN